MPDFAPNVTGRYKLHYNVIGRVHTIMMRTARGLNAAQIISNGAAYLRGLFVAMAPGMADDLAFISAEYALHDSDLFFPAATPAAVVGAIAAATFSKQDSITHLTFSGRGALGSKVSMHLYGHGTDPDTLPANIWSDFVVLGTELPRIATAVAALNVAPALAVAIDNSVPVYVNRATVKVNDFWLRKVRQGL
jgi:hypothetical protein